jgi:hypothetical protein
MRTFAYLALIAGSLACGLPRERGAWECEECR